MLHLEFRALNKFGELRPRCDENDPNGPFFDPVHGVIHHFYQKHIARDAEAGSFATRSESFGLSVFAHFGSGSTNLSVYTTTDSGS